LRTLNKPIVVLAVGVVAVVLNVLLYFGLPALLYFTYHGLFVPRLPPLIARPETPPAEHFTAPMPPSKTLLEPKPNPKGERREEGAWAEPVEDGDPYSPTFGEGEFCEVRIAAILMATSYSPLCRSTTILTTSS
jgi:hypothetical protein